MSDETKRIIDKQVPMHKRWAQDKPPAIIPSKNEDGEQNELISKMKVIAVQGKDRFLIIENEVDEYARVLDLKQQIFFRPFYLQSILARGYWDEFKGDRKTEIQIVKIAISYDKQGK